MASSDLDPLFLRALKLLQSRSKESGDQLRQLYDEVAAQRRSEVLSKRLSDSIELTSKTTIKKEYSDNDRKREFDKLKQDLAELSQEVPLKKAKLESSASSSSSGSPRSTDAKERSDRDRSTSEKSKSSVIEVKKEKPRERLREIEEDIFFGPSPSLLSTNRVKERERLERDEREKAKLKEKEAVKVKIEPPPVLTMVPIMAATATVDDSGSETEVSGDDTLEEDNAEDTDNMDEMQFELLGSLSCVICKSLSVTSSNRLLECQECHSLYHQDCHKPPVTDNVNDPRFVWYCSKCAKNLKKIVIKNQKKPVKLPSTVTSRESPVFKPSKPEPPVLLQPFKRIEPSKLSSGKETPVAGVQTGVTAGRGLAGLAANLNNRSSTSAPTITPPDSLKIKLETPVGGASRPTVSSSKSSSELKSNTVSPGWGSVNRSIPPTITKTDALKPPAKYVTSSSSSTATTQSSSVKIQQQQQPTTAATIGSVGANSAGGKMSQSTMMNADKRLQIMKKKAAAKMVEKRIR